MQMKDLCLYTWKRIVPNANVLFKCLPMQLHSLRTIGMFSYLGSHKKRLSLWSFSQINKFQVVAAFNQTNNAIFVLYQYQDGMLQWSSSNLKVELHICDDEWTYDPLSILTNSNVKEPGRYAFLYNDSGINPARNL